MHEPEQSTLSSAAFLTRLKALADARLGLPIRSHRPAPIGSIIVGFKKAFRLLAQPLINETLAKQAALNEELIEWSRAVINDIEANERSMLAMRTGLEIRMSRLDAVIARLEKQANLASPAAVSTGTQPTRKH
jgi:hypothetical protein